PVQPLGRGEGQAWRQLYAAQPCQLLELVLFQPAVAADREGPGHHPGGGQLQSGDQVVNVAELPAGSAALDRQQPRRLEVPGNKRVDAVSDQGSRPGDGDLQTGVRARRALRQMLDLQQVADDTVV